MIDVKTLCDVDCELGEGPFYCERRDTLFWFDIIGRKRHSYQFSTGVKAAQKLPEMASAMAVIDENTDVLLTESGLWAFDFSTGAFSPIASVETDNEGTRSNDARVHPSGAFWLSTMGKNTETGAGAIYHFAHGTLEKLFADLTIPNAICFSPSGDLAYFTDTSQAKLMSVLLNAETGLPLDAPKVLIDHTRQTGGLDGAITDADGNIWVALWGASCVNGYTPEGQFIKSFPVPASQPTCPAFVGGGKIAVTTAWQHMDESQRAADKNAGHTFLIDANLTPKFEPQVTL